ncbi:MAG TPA: glycosyltransferase family 2 protein [Polyangiaceae bacterium]|nr:glycosyltransferase family 2 protein [Polyangiaceae bacterium]
MSAPPHVSIVIPVYNEQAILRDAVEELIAELVAEGTAFEIVLSENGSTDDTVGLARALAQADARVRVLSSPEPNYGLALRSGIISARGDIVLCEEIDWCDAEFRRRAVALIETGKADFVIGSKLLGESRDERPWLRHVASLCYTRLLHALFDFQGTDTHGLKALRRSRLLEVVEACRVEKDVFASELVIRAARSGVRLCEIPVQVREKRPPSINLLKRVPNVLSNLGRLAWAIHVESRVAAADSRGVR